MRALACNLLRRKRRTCRVAPGRITDQSSEVADEKDDLVPEVLELAHLVDEHGVAEVQIGRGRIEARLDSQRLAALEAWSAAPIRAEFRRSTLEFGEIVLQGTPWPFIIIVD